MEILEQKRPLPRPHSPPRPLNTESDEESYNHGESSPLQLKNLSENSNRINAGKIFQLSTHKCPGGLNSTSVHRSSSLEHRLQGATSAVKHLEKELKKKTSQIQKLESELQEKTKLIENYSSQIASAQTHQKSSMLQSSITTIIRKKEKELEKMIKSQQEKIEEDKKTMFRLQELNKTLVSKMKEQDKRLEEIEISSSEKLNKYHLNRNLVEENEHLAIVSRKTKQEVNNLKEESKTWQEKYNNLLASSMEFEYQTRELYKANQVLNENILKLLETNQI